MLIKAIISKFIIHKKNCTVLIFQKLNIICNGYKQAVADCQSRATTMDNRYTHTCSANSYQNQTYQNGIER